MSIKCNIWDLKEDHYYIEPISRRIYTIINGDLCYYGSTGPNTKKWLKSEDFFNEIHNKIFYEIDSYINWDKVERGTRVCVRNSLEEEWRNAYFYSYFYSTGLFMVGYHGDDNFTGVRMEDTLIESYRYCKLADVQSNSKYWTIDIDKIMEAIKNDNN